MPVESVRYESDWEEDLRRLVLYGPNFDFFWQKIEESVIRLPTVGYPILDGSGASAFLTNQTGWLDLPPLVVYFKYDPETRRLVFLGLDLAATADDYPPSDWFPAAESPGQP